MLAVSDESAKDVEDYVKANRLRLKVGAEFTGGAAWGVASYPSSALVSPSGKLLWLGHPSRLTPEMIENALSKAGD